MGVPNSEVGYASAMPRREDHEVHKRTCGGIGGKKNVYINLKNEDFSHTHTHTHIYIYIYIKLETKFWRSEDYIKIYLEGKNVRV